MSKIVAIGSRWQVATVRNQAHSLVEHVRGWPRGGLQPSQVGGSRNAQVDRQGFFPLEALGEARCLTLRSHFSVGGPANRSTTTTYR